MGPLHDKIFKEPLVFKNGYIAPPTGPGLGVELDEAMMKKYAVKITVDHD